MPRTVVKIGPSDHGRRMSLEDFEHAEGAEGYLYELGKGVVVVMPVPKLRHLRQVDAIRRHFFMYQLAHPGVINLIAGGNECAILLRDLESERHPDLAVYKTAPPEEDAELWVNWVPEIVVEVVSPDSSEERDYVEKREEYLRFGVREYWVFDADKREMLVLRRVGKRWSERIVRPPEIYRTRLLPHLDFACAVVFEAADAAGT